jgi:hypothetical protein
MPLQSSSLETPVTDFGVSGILDGRVLAMDVLDPTENNEVGLLHEVDDDFVVRLTWQLSGVMCWFIGGYWLVSLYIVDIDGRGAAKGLIGSGSLQIKPGPSPRTYRHSFKVDPGKWKQPREGLYKLTATISYSPTGRPDQLAEMFGFAESKPIRIAKIELETPADN